MGDHGGGGREEQGRADGDEDGHQGELQEVAGQGEARQAGGDGQEAQAQGAHLAQPPDHRPQDQGPHEQRHAADVGVEPADGRLGDAEDALEVEGDDAVHGHEGHHAEGVDPDQGAHRAGGAGGDVEHRGSGGAGRGLSARLPAALGQRLGQPDHAEEEVEDAEARRQVAGPDPAQGLGQGADGRAHHDAGAGGHGEPAQRLGPVLARHRVAQVGLHHAHGAGAAALDQPGDEQQPDGGGRLEDDVGRRGDEQATEDHGPPAVAVRQPAPERRRRHLAEGEGGDEDSHHGRVAAQLLGVERQQRQDDEEADHVHEDREHEHPEPADEVPHVHQIASSPLRVMKAAALMTMSSTP